MNRTRQRLDQHLVSRGLVRSRSQAESYIKLGLVVLNGSIITKPGVLVSPGDKITLSADEQFVSRAALKLQSVAKLLRITFNDKLVLDVGSSTGGFTEYALRHGARKVIAVDSGTDQLHDSLRYNPKIELHEKTDIRDFYPDQSPDLILIDVSFISLRKILPHLYKVAGPKTEILAMIKPQFETNEAGIKHKGVIKNDHLRREILKQFEAWLQQQFIIIDKTDSKVAGAKGNVERFYRLQKQAIL